MTQTQTEVVNDRRAPWRSAVAAVAAAAIVLPLGWMWWDSRLPGTYSATDMGTPDYGGGPSGGHDHHGATSIATLTGPRSGTPAVRVDLTARAERFDVTGKQIDGYTLNHSSPGPTIRVRQGDLLEVVLRNENVDDGVTLHWHGLDVPNAEDGVAGVTQDAVPEGGSHTYRFLAEDAGTYWYHSHQVSHRQVQRGLWGVLVIEPRTPVRDVVAAVHTYSGVRTVNGAETQTVDAAPGSTLRVRVVNTDASSLRAWVQGAPYKVVAVDAREVTGPGEVRDRNIRVAAGGRVDLEVTVPSGGALVGLGGRNVVRVGPSADAPVQPADELDLLSYGTPTPLTFDVDAAQRRFNYNIGRRPGFVDGKPGVWWSINGKLFPDVPMFMVTEGDVVRMKIKNGSGELHPMHLHGHHALVLSRNGVPATGSRWWVDSLDVPAGDTFEIAFVADNPGIWMDHCHNLKHAAEGLVAHLMYEGYSTPYVVGGKAHNHPE